ncbi:MAG: hypothetical protein N2578_10440 [Bdellovibrionaceae bacterium]|nr:hypothetical protein [Pseudobdellovibrionaceae bacterium]
MGSRISMGVSYQRTGDQLKWNARLKLTHLSVDESQEFKSQEISITYERDRIRLPSTKHYPRANNSQVGQFLGQPEVAV